MRFLLFALAVSGSLAAQTQQLSIPVEKGFVGGEPGDRIAKLTLHGGLHNPPVLGQPECDCHALVPVTSAPMEKGGSRLANRSVTLMAEGARQIDFKGVHWGGLDVLAALRIFDRALIPAGFAGPMSPLRQLQIQVKAHKY